VDGPHRNTLREGEEPGSFYGVRLLPGGQASGAASAAYRVIEPVHDVFKMSPAGPRAILCDHEGAIAFDFRTGRRTRPASTTCSRSSTIGNRGWGSCAPTRGDW
jgi:hypothetical protein